MLATAITRPCGRDFRRIGFPASRRRLRSTCSLAVPVAGSLHAPMWGREGAARRDTASRPGKLIPRANVGATSDGWVCIVAGDGFDLRAYEGVTRPPRCDVVSCCLRPISLHAPMWARARHAAPDY